MNLKLVINFYNVEKMSNFKTKNIVDLPDEIIEECLMPHLAYKDLCSLVKVGNSRLKNCSVRCLRHIFCKYVHCLIFLIISYN